MGKADLHVHTTYSYDGTCTVEAVLQQAAYHAGLDVIAITDHNETAGAKEALRLAPRYGIQVIPGEEISTKAGHLLAYFIQETIPAGLPLAETALRVRQQGGICVAAHPYAAGTNSIKGDDIRQALEVPGVADALIGIETFNYGLIFPHTNDMALELAQELNLAAVGGSDSHILETIGHGYTSFPGSTAADLRRSLLKRTSRSRKAAQHDVHFYLAHLRGWSLRAIGWVTAIRNTQSSSPFVLRRLERGHSL
jgi:predicted metal-dependent phosphoesterase TrpH